MKKTNKILSIILTILMVVTTVPFAFAAETDEALWGTADNLAFSGTLSEAFSAAESNSEITYIKLNSNITLSEELYIYGGSFTLDINGKTLSLDIDEENVWATTIFFFGEETVVFDDTATEKGEIISEGVGVKIGCGKGIFKNISITGKSYGIAVSADGEGEIDGAEVTGTDCAGVKPDGAVMMKSGTASGTYAVRLTEDCSVFTMLGGNLEGEQADIDYWYGTVDLSGINNPEGITFYNCSGTLLDASSVSLPYDYHFYDADGNYQNGLEVDGTYTIQEHMQTCKSSVCELCNEYVGVGEHADKDENNLCDLCNEFSGNEIKPGDTYTVTKEEFVKFVPTVSGNHIISSVSDVDPKVTLFDADFTNIAEADDGYYREENGLDFYLEYELTAGETYYFKFYDYNGEYNYTVNIIEPCSVHTGGIQTCKGFKCEVCESWYGEAGEHTAEGEQTCLGTLCSVCDEYFGEVSEHNLSSEQTCLGYYCYSCDDYYGEADPDAHNWNDTYCYICDAEHDHTGGTQTCRGYKCDICGGWYGESGEQHDLSAEQTCMGYKCNWCYRYFGEKGEHVPDTEQTCKGYGCKYCNEWFGEADLSKHSWYYGYCDYCDIEYPADEECTHDLNNYGQCIICGYQCPHDTMENGTCTSCPYSLPFSLTTGETVTYHSSFSDALDKAEDGSTVKVLKDNLSMPNLTINKAIILDLNGKVWESEYPTVRPTCDVNAGVTFTDSVGGGYLAYTVNLNTADAIFEDGSYAVICIYHEDSTFGDYLAPCKAYYNGEGELLEFTNEDYYLGRIEIKDNHNLGTQTCKGYKCEDCGEWFGEADPDAHDWIRNILVRPTRNTDGSWTDGYYYDKCKNDEAHNVLIGIAKRADYTAYDNACAKLSEYFSTVELTEAAIEEIRNTLALTTMVPSNLVEGESSLAFMNNWVKSAETIIAKIESGEYVKVDNTEIAEVINAIAEVLETAKISEEMENELIDIKAQLEPLKENENLTMADVIELYKRLEAIAEIMDNCAKGIHSFTKYEETVAPTCKKAGKEVATCNHGCGATDEQEIPALTHSFTKYEEVEVPKCGVVGKEVATCDNGCGETDEKEIPALQHIDTDGDYECDHDCGYEFEKPAEPDTPDEPTDDTCDHLCHSNNALMKVLWKIISFLQRLFGIQQYCDCGELHYEKAIFG